MNSKTKLSLAVLAALAGISPLANAEEQREGFIEGSSLNILNRNFYFNRDNRNGESGAGGAGYSETWAHGIIGQFESGFTRGTVGVGVDAFAMLGLKLDTGGGRNGGRSTFDVLPVDSNGEARDEYSKVGGALKARAFDTVLKVGDVFPTTPVVHYGDSRLLPESFRGITLENSSVNGLTLQGGRLHAMSQPVSSDMRDKFATFYAGPVDSPWVGYFGGDYSVNENLQVSAYSARLKDAWDQYYFGASLTQPLTEDVSLITGFNYYNVQDEGKQLLGELNNNIWSAKVGVQFGAHTVTLSHQRNNGDDDFDYLRQADSIYLDNSIQYTDFNSPKERSWMVRYDLNMQAYGIPGLSFMARYGKGTDADYSNANDVYMRRDADGNPLVDQKRWERDIEAKYVVQTGSLKDMSFRIRQANTRATQFESDLDEFRLIVEHPLSVL
ncbi:MULTISPECIES: OprD family porin [Pseudomonas]|uniref:OprD family porin n=1 Tax=Pseudomonas TaxID=286 RepID=UPI0002DFFFC3|nr:MULTISPECIES: OprD family porin [Pseudomonas]MDG9927768.1 OprD family porin [Pseudomonas sp. GD04042]MDH0483133.1 OprD family porin [Pseudomonas sp. GD04015]MDH0605326.1 OprD family porin [Pseudomonas sp. GD03869]